MMNEHFLDSQHLVLENVSDSKFFHFAILQPPVQVKGLDGLLRTSLDLELDLQVTRTRHNRLNEELHVLRELKKQLEEARQKGQHTLPAWVQEDERFRLLLKHTERQVQTPSLKSHPPKTAIDAQIKAKCSKRLSCRERLWFVLVNSYIPQ